MTDADADAAREEDASDSDEATGWGFAGAPVTAALFMTNLGVYAAEAWLAPDWRWAIAGPDPSDQRKWDHLLRWLGANASLWTIADNRVETLVTSCFLHASLLHLALNLVILHQVGRLVERSIGSARFFPLYLTAGIVGSATSAIWGRFYGQGLSVGASGAVCGLIGAAIVLGIRTEGWRNDLSFRMAFWLLALLLIPSIAAWVRHEQQLLHVDNAAHVGGAAAGLLVAIMWRRTYTPAVREKRAILAGCVALVLASSALVYWRDRNDPFLFLDLGERTNIALEAWGAGRCGRARTAIERAITMDRTNRALQGLRADIMRECK
ncbi:MAG TPA: rhomboid family intramembrane serine protease [Labilithrix sp.]